MPTMTYMSDGDLYASRLPSEDVAGALRAYGEARKVGTSAARGRVSWLYSWVWREVTRVDEEKNNADSG